VVDPDRLRRAWASISDFSNRALAEELVSLGWAARSQVEEWLEETPAGMTFSDYLVESGRIARERLAELVPLPADCFCPNCQKGVRVEGAQPGARYRCHRCGGELLAQTSRESVEASEVLQDPVDYPPRVREAASIPENHFGKFVRIAQLGRGGMGTVWECYDRNLRRFVAVKILEQAGDSTIQRFLREAKVAARLEHPNIARVYEVGSWQNSHYIVMELIQGCNLSARMELRESLGHLAQAAEAIHFAHEQGVIHRDLKPDNIMVTPAGHVYVLDFGLAREIETSVSISVTGTVLGTPPYMSPEQIQGALHRIDARSDVYSLGATLYELAAGQPPFQGAGFAEILSQVVDVDPVAVRQIRPGTPVEIETIALKAMEKDPARRYSSAREFADDVRRYLRGEPILARPSGWCYRLWKRVRRKPLAYGAVSVAVLMLLLSAYIWVGRRIRDREDFQRFYASGTVKLNGGDLEGAYQDLCQAYSIDAPSTDALLSDVLRRLDDRRKEQEERQRIDPLLQRLRRISWTLVPADTGPELKSIREQAEKLARERAEWSGSHLALGISLNLDSKCSGSSEDLKNAIRHLNRAIDLSRGRRPDYHVEGLLQRGLAYGHLAGRDMRFRFVFSSDETPPIFKVDPPDAEAREDTERALADLSVALPKTIENPRAHLEAVVLELQGKYESAARHLEHSGTQSVDGVLLRARCGLFLGRADLRNAVEFLAEQTRRIDAWQIAVYLCLLDREWGRAEKHLDRLIEGKGARVSWLTLRGVARWQTGRLKEAVEDYTRAIEIDPLHADFYVWRAEGLRRLGNPAASIRDASRSIELAPKASAGYMTRAQSRYSIGDLKGALEDATRLVNLAPTFERAYTLRGGIRLAMGEYQGAIEDLDEALRLNPANAKSYRDRGHARSKLGDFEGALGDAQEAIRIEPDRADGYLYRAAARWYLSESDPARAEELLRQAEGDLLLALKAARATDSTRARARTKLEQVRSKLAALKRDW
jgi:tetratricopeptide (TPR) repeat protein